MYEKLVEKFQTELHKTTSRLSLEITSLGSHTDLLETEHVELTLAHADLHKDYESMYNLRWKTLTTVNIGTTCGCEAFQKPLQTS